MLTVLEWIAAAFGLLGLALASSAFIVFVACRTLPERTACEDEGDAR